VEFFRNPNIDFLGKKWYFLAFSLLFSVAGVLSMLFWHGIPLGVDFRGGTLVYVKFSHTPDDNAIRAALQKADLQRARIQRYGAFRFEWIYGVAAVVTVFHDTLITVGAFSLISKEISLTVIAAILTLVGYSNNDTIVVFDRIRENLKLMRREKLSDIVNRSINQTLSRTILTAGLTFLTVLALYLFGGEVLHGFSFALVIGILIGTYSSIAIAAPILVAYQDWKAKRGRPVTGPGGRGTQAGQGEGLKPTSPNQGPKAAVTR